MNISTGNITDVSVSVTKRGRSIWIEITEVGGSISVYLRPQEALALMDALPAAVKELRWHESYDDNTHPVAQRLIAMNCGGE